MIVDSSALVAVAKQESDAERYVAAMARAASVGLPAPALVETSMVVGSMGPAAVLRFDDLRRAMGIEILDFTAAHADAAVKAFAAFGRGSGHPARLNFGDCMVYAVAATSGESLLFKGEDFTHTDLRSAL